MPNKQFYDLVREPLFSARLTPQQVINIELIAEEATQRNLKDQRQVAYILATTFHETARTMRPIEEYGKGANNTYGKRIKFSGVPYYDTNNLFYGRGHTQNTWYETYERLTKLAKFQGKDWNFIQNPELLLEPKISVWAMYEGMTKGLYTGRKLSDYFNNSIEDPIEARRIINGTRKGEKTVHNGIAIADKADIIANYYNTFFKALTE